MFYQNLAIVFCFLSVLVFLKYYLQRRKENTEGLVGDERKIFLTSRLNLSKSSHVDVLKVGSETFLVVFSKSAQPAVMKLENLNFQEPRERAINDE